MKKLVAIICAVLIVSSAVVSVSSANPNEPAETLASEQTNSEIDPEQNVTEDSNDDTGDDESKQPEEEAKLDDEANSEDIDGNVEENELMPYALEDCAFTVTGDTEFCSYEDGVLTVLGGNVTISSSGTKVTDRIVVNGTATITLNNVNIDARTKNASAFEIKSGSAFIILEGDNTLTSGSGVDKDTGGFYGYAGLQNNSVPVTITGSGSLTATGGNYGGAGIGGGKGGNGENITIDENFSGTITAKGCELNEFGAGIGGGSGGNGKNIKIYGSGTVNATGGRDGGAGIGGGDNGGSGTNITISMSGGKVIAKSGSVGGAGIGGGKGGDGENIIISGSGNVTAKGDNGVGAGIGGGGGDNYGENFGNGKNITISGSVNVTATGGSDGGAGIGGGQGGDGDDINISTSGNVTASGSYGGAGIGGGGSYYSYIWATSETKTSNGGDGTNITISGSGNVVASGGNGGAGIGGGGGNSSNGLNGGNGTNIEISSSGTVNASSSYGGAGIGGGGDNSGTGGNGGNGTDITISGSGTVEASGGWYGGAGIGSGNGSSGASSITISDGTVTAKGGSDSGKGIGGAGIGSGSGSTGTSSITISGGTVTATGGTYGGAGIGSGSGSTGTSSITISGGEVKATGNSGQGIGGENSTVNIDAVNIEGESETSYPLVETNGIKSTNGNDNYRGIVFFDENHINGTVYGTVKLTEPYTIEDGQTLRVHKNATLITNNNLTLAGTLYLEDGAKLENWYEITDAGGEIQHKAKSNYKDYASVTYGLTYAERDSEEENYLCDICGTPEPHDPTVDGDWQYNSTHHWHNGECNLENAYDCSVDMNAIEKCSYMVDGKFDYKEHKYGTPEDEGSKLRYTCEVCGYTYTKDKPIVTESPVTEPPVTEPPVTEPPVTEPPVTEPTETTAPTETTVPSGGGNRPSYSSPVTTTVTTTYTETEYYPNDYTGEDISAEAGFYEDDNDGINVIPPIILIVITAASAFVLYRREKK